MSKGGLYNDIKDGYTVKKTHEMYAKMDLSYLESFLHKLSEPSNNLKKQLKNVCVEDLGNGMYKWGPIICGKEGLKQLDKALCRKTQ